MKNIKHTHNNAKGFTLIKLMIVVAIIGILAAVALPAYSDYTTRARMSEAILAASSCKTNVTEFYQTRSDSGDYMANMFGCGEVPMGDNFSQFINNITTDANGVITVAVNGDISADIDNDDTIILTPVIDDMDTALTNAMAGTTPFGWTCTSTTIDDQFLPASCR